MKKIKFFVPAFNEEKNIELLIKDILKLDLENPEVFFCDDGSHDETWNWIKKCKEKFSNQIEVGAIKLLRNYGKDNAILALLENFYLKKDIIVICDADLQHPILALKEKLTDIEANSITVGLKTNKSYTIVRKFFSNIFNKIFLKDMPGIKENSSLTDFCIIRSDNLLTEINANNFMLKNFILSTGLKKKFFLFDEVSRIVGKSKFGLVNLYLYFFEVILSKNTKPLKLLLHLGLFMNISSILLLFVSLISKFLLNIFITNTAILVMILIFLTSIIIISIGLNSFYLSNLYESLNSKKYFVKEILK